MGFFFGSVFSSSNAPDPRRFVSGRSRHVTTHHGRGFHEAAGFGLVWFGGAGMGRWGKLASVRVESREACYLPEFTARLVLHGSPETKSSGSPSPTSRKTWSVHLSGGFLWESLGVLGGTFLQTRQKAEAFPRPATVRAGPSRLRKVQVDDWKAFQHFSLELREPGHMITLFHCSVNNCKHITNTAEFGCGDQFACVLEARTFFHPITSPSCWQRSCLFSLVLPIECMAPAMSPPKYHWHEA